MNGTHTKEDHMTIGERIEQSMSAHFCLKNAWAEFKTKDPVDAYKNAQALLAACEERMNAQGIKTR
jgi:hypothetical protein